MDRKKRKPAVWKKAAACGLAVAFLLTACGGMAKSEATASSGDYEAGGGAVHSSSYAAKDTYSTWDRDEAAEEMVEMEAEYDTPLAGAFTESADDANRAAVNTDAGTEDGTGGAEQADLNSANRKIIYTGNVSLQTLEYDKSSQSIHDKITKYGGFIESEDTSNNDPYWYYSERSGSAAKRTCRYLNITARIPADQFDAFMKDLENDGQVTNTSINARNISVNYANHDASRKALEIEQERLLKMMDKAETVEDMIAVEGRLTEVERELGNEKTVLSDMDRDVNFSTVYISLEEVFEYSEQVVEVTYGERLQRAFGRAIEGFVTFWEDLLLFLVETFPFLIMLAVILVIIVKLVRRGRRRRMEKKARLEEARRAAMMSAAPGFGTPAPSGTPGPGASVPPGAAADRGEQRPPEISAADGTGRREQDT